jgi:hypothetical protein
MDVTINRLNPNVPDPVESRRRAAGRLVRIAYATAVFGVVGFFVIYFGAPFVFLRGPGTVTSTRYVVSLPYTVQVGQISLVPGATVKAGEEIGAVFSPEQDSIVATYMRALADIAGRTAELRIKARVAQDSLEASRSYQLVTQEAVERLGAMTAATVTFRMEVLREYAAARKAVVSQEAEVAESAIQLASLDQFIQQIRGRLDEVEQHFGKGRVFAPIAGIVSTVSHMSVHRWWRARRSPKSSIRPIFLWTGTFPTNASSIPKSGTKSLCCSVIGAFPERSPKSCRFLVCTPARSGSSF